MEWMLIDDAVTFRRGLADLLLGLVANPAGSSLPAAVAALLSPAKEAGVALFVAGEMQGWIVVSTGQGAEQAIHRLAGIELPLEAIHQAVSGPGYTPLGGGPQSPDNTAWPGGPLKGAVARLHNLSPREVEVLELLAGGLSNGEIATCLFVTENTVKNHVWSILKKLNVKNRREAARLARRQGWVRYLDGSLEGGA